MLHKTHAELLALMPPAELAEWIGFFAYDAAREEQRQARAELEAEQRKKSRGRRRGK